MDRMPIISIDYTLFWQIINFFIIILIFNRYFKKPLAKIIKERKQIISENLDSAEKNNKEAEAKLKNAEDNLISSKKEALEIIRKAERRASDEEIKIVREARETGEKIIKHARLEADRMKKDFHEDMVEEAKELSINLAEMLLREKIDGKIESQLISEFIDKVGE